MTITMRRARLLMDMTQSDAATAIGFDRWSLNRVENGKLDYPALFGQFCNLFTRWCHHEGTDLIIAIPTILYPFGGDE